MPVSQAHAFAFKRVPDGVLFAPAVALLGNSLGSRFGATYLLNDAQQSDVAAVLERFNSRLRAIGMAYFVLCLAMILFGMIAALAPAMLPALPHIPRGLFMTIAAIAMVGPFAIAFIWFGFALRGALAGAQRSEQRISADEVFSGEAAYWSMGRLRVQLAVTIGFAILASLRIADGFVRGYPRSNLLWLVLLPLAIGLAIHYVRLMRAKRADV